MDVTLVSLDSIKKSGWTFKVSQCDSEVGDGFLVVAVFDLMDYSRIKYFSSSEQAREWINDLVNITQTLQTDALHTFTRP
jgi:hypothetical protein